MVTNLLTLLAGNISVLEERDSLEVLWDRLNELVKKITKCYLNNKHSQLRYNCINESFW